MPNDKLTIVVVEDAKVGKSELVNRLVGRKEFNDNYVATIGLDLFAYKKIQWLFIFLI